MNVVYGLDTNQLRLENERVAGAVIERLDFDFGGLRATDR